MRDDWNRSFLDVTKAILALLEALPIVGDPERIGEFFQLLEQANDLLKKLPESEWSPGLREFKQVFDRMGQQQYKKWVEHMLMIQQIERLLEGRRRG